MECKSKLINIRIASRKSDKQNSEIKKIMNLYDAQEEVIKIYKDYFTMIYNARYDATHRKRLKVLNLKQMLQRLPISLEQVKAGNTSANLLNEIFQIIYTLHQSKEITKKVYNNIMNLIKL